MENVVEGGANVMTELFTNMTPVITSLLDVVTSVITWGLDNPVVMLSFAASIVGIGVAIFGAIKNAI